MYIGSVAKLHHRLWVCDFRNMRMVKHDVSFYPGVVKVWLARLHALLWVERRCVAAVRCAAAYAVQLFRIFIYIVYYIYSIFGIWYLFGIFRLRILQQMQCHSSHLSRSLAAVRRGARERDRQQAARPGDELYRGGRLARRAGRAFMVQRAQRRPWHPRADAQD